MTAGGFDTEATFDEDYLWFYEPTLTAERSRREVDEIISTLGITEAAVILDAPCGHGRISNLLAADGHTVTGVDITALFLDRARQDAQALGVEVDYRHGDLRDLPVGGPFDALVCWFTSFGYFDDTGNRAVLEQFAEVLRPGGTLLIETMNHDGFVRNFSSAPAATLTERGDDVMIDQSWFDPLGGRIETDRTVHRGGEVRRSHHSIRLPTVPEFDDWLDTAGFSRRDYTDRGGRPLTADSWRLVVKATK
ncbi:MAG: methyltransferase domain-containing protein [Sulfitobacter sp.]|nr:methyltransferase domain-containing protein [Sulfitobacter sp.]